MNRSLDAIFRPRSVAVIGASRREGSIGGEILAKLLEGGFEGAVYPVNPHADFLHSIKCYPSISDIPDPVDLAMIVVPRDSVPGVVEECRRKKVHGLVVITAGFREVGEEGARLEAKIRDKVRKAGMRMVGPNCMGVINTHPAVSMNATFAASAPTRGRSGFMSQSGALGEIILANARHIGLGISMFASVGNKADVSGNDLIEYWEDDPTVDVMLMYLESFGNPRKFTTIAQRATRKKPIIAVKSGRTEAGARAAFSHTGSLAGGDVATSTLFDQCGVLRVNTIEEMFTLATAFTSQPLPKGNRVAILTNAGGPAIMATDAAITLGLTLSPLEETTRRELRRKLPPECSVANPVDLIASADADRYDVALKLLLKDPTVDGLMVLFVAPTMINSREVARTIARRCTKSRKPVLACFMGKDRGAEGMQALRASSIPVYSFPEEAAQAMAAMDRYRRIRIRPRGRTVRFHCDRARVRLLLSYVRRKRRSELTLEETQEVLKGYGFPQPPSRIVTSAAAAIEASLELGYPVVLKAVLPELSHKTEAGGVRVDLRNGDEVGRTYREMAQRLKKRALPVLVQKMIRGGREVILGSFQDRQFGTLLMFGLGGIFVEAMKDVAFRVHPITDRDASEMITSLRGYPLLKGFRGEPGVSEKLLVEMILRLSQLLSDFPEIEQVDINPFIVGSRRSESFAVDARIALQRR
ncbi:MAG TPA: acetate--CoA ligase family protein [Candidatus Polarisedimenticolia bacterium]|nr:acetate--CoA ligase family protein [Candidatus Polarisedimenticolia bacterium]